MDLTQWISGESPADAAIRWTIRIALALYAVRLGYDLWRRGIQTAPPVWLRAVWTGGLLLILVHLALAFHFAHGWSISHAYSHTASRTFSLTGFRSGAGLWLNFVFAAFWAIDVFWMLLAPGRYAQRVRLWPIVGHAFALFMTVNAAIVFEAGLTRLVASAIALALAAVAIWRLKS